MKKKIENRKKNFSQIFDRWGGGHVTNVVNRLGGPRFGAV
jgi:hypothetical protein